MGETHWLELMNLKVPTTYSHMHTNINWVPLIQDIIFHEPGHDGPSST